MPRATSKHPVPLLFYGYSATVIARWCGISRRTALAYKRGSRRPSAAVLRLFVLYRDRQVIPAEWGPGYFLTATSIVTPEGIDIPFTWLRGWHSLMDWARGISRSAGRRSEFEHRLARVPGRHRG